MIDLRKISAGSGCLRGYDCAIHNYTDKVKWCGYRVSVCRSDAFSSKEDRAIPPPIENFRLVVSLPNEMLCGLFDAIWSIPKESIT